MKKMKCFIKTSSPHQVGLKKFGLTRGRPPEPNDGSGRGEGFKKNPQPSHGRLGILPADTLHSLILEDLFVKNIQAGFLTLGSSYFLRLPILSLSKDSGFIARAHSKFRPRLQRRVRPRLSPS